MPGLLSVVCLLRINFQCLMEIIFILQYKQTKFKTDDGKEMACCRFTSRLDSLSPVGAAALCAVVHALCPCQPLHMLSFGLLMLIAKEQMLNTYFQGS